jgi:hypothetical protein
MSHQAPGSSNADARIDPRVIDLHPVQPRALARRAIELPVNLAGLLGAGSQTGSEQWLQSFLQQLGPGEATTLRICFGRSGGLWLGVSVCAPAAVLEKRARPPSSPFSPAQCRASSRCDCSQQGNAHRGTPWKFGRLVG